MTFRYPSPALVERQLFVSRPLLVLSCFTLWALSLFFTVEASAEPGKDAVRLATVATDLLGLVLAIFASDTRTKRRMLRYIRVAWFATSITSGFLTAHVVTEESGFQTLALNVLLATTMVFLVAMRWNLVGFMLMIIANSALSVAYFSATPRTDSDQAFLIWFLTLLPGLLGTAKVLFRREIMKRSMARKASTSLDALTARINSNVARQVTELEHTQQQIQALFARTAAAQALPLDPELSEEARLLASRLRSLLLLARSSSWLAEALALAGLESEVRVVSPVECVERVLESSRASVLAATMLIAAWDRDANTYPKGAGVPHRIHFFAEPLREEKMLLTWRVAGAHQNACSPALWSELESLGTPQLRSDPVGTSIMVLTPAARAW